MRKIKLIFTFILALMLFPVLNSFGNPSENILQVLEVQQYSRAIHIMAMLLVGFGFLMVFVKKYGRSALTATFLLVSVSIPLYFGMSDLDIFASLQKLIFSNFEILEHKTEIEKFVLAEFGAASLLIAAGAVLGRLKMSQYIVLGLLFIPFYMLNEWIIIENGLGIIKSFADTGGSIVIHAFGAIFGIGVAIVNVFLALCGSTVITFILSKTIRGKINIADIANAALAGGVAIGATCDHAPHWAAILIGIVAGAISTIGFALIQGRQQKFLKAVDTCGVTNLHGLPGIFGGLAALIFVSGINFGSQLLGILITIASALIFGFITGKVLSLFGRRKVVYDDAEEFEDAD